MGSLITSVFRLDLRRFRFDVHRVRWLAAIGLFCWRRRLVCFGKCRLLLHSNHAPSQQRRDVSVSRFVAHIYLRFACLGRRQKPSVLETWDTERGFSKTKSSGSGKASPRLPKTGSSVLELRSESIIRSRSSATHRRIPRSKISAIDRKRTDAGSFGCSSSAGRELIE